MSAPTLLLIDDHAMFRSGLGMVLRAALPEAQFFEAGSLEDAMGKSCVPDLLLLDIRLQGLNGLDGIALLKRKWPHASVVMLSSDMSPETRRRALELGAAAYVSKAETADNMIELIARVLGNEPVMTESAPNGAASVRPLLTPRQCEVLDLVCQGLSNKVIGKRLGLSENTVRGHVQALLVALKVNSRSEAAFAARKLGLVN